MENGISFCSFLRRGGGRPPAMALLLAMISGHNNNNRLLHQIDMYLFLFTFAFHSTSFSFFSFFLSSLRSLGFVACCLVVVARDLRWNDFSLFLFYSVALSLSLSLSLSFFLSFFQRARFDRVWPSFVQATGLDQNLLGFTGFFWVLPSFTWYYWVFPGFY